jgi:hypothetical protein
LHWVIARFGDWVLGDWVIALSDWVIALGDWVIALAIG